MRVLRTLTDKTTRLDRRLFVLVMSQREKQQIVQDGTQLDSTQAFSCLFVLSFSDLGGVSKVFHRKTLVLPPLAR